MRRILFNYVALIFFSACLVFAVQPIVGRMLLPLLGGTAVVWNTCLVFFQAALLGGYVYAHVLATRLAFAPQIVVHLAFLALGGLFLPFSFADVARPGDTIPALWVLLTITVAIGLPFAALSASAPLFQSWFARTPHRDAQDPYHLYAASNLGSILALVSYPFLIEPNLALAEQAWTWSVGYAVLVALVCWTAFATWKVTEPEARRPAQRDGSEGDRPSFAQLAQWVFLAAVPSGLLLAVTTHLTMDIAAIPLLWMAPLVLYLVSYVLAFAKRKLLPTRIWMALGIPAAMAVTARLAIGTPEALWTGLPLHLVAFLLVATMHHSLLADSRPATQHLTAYYIAMSFGGVCGGSFVALIAPAIFNSTFEYPLLLVLATLVYVRHSSKIVDHTIARRLFVAGFGLTVVAVVFWLREPNTVILVYALCALIALLMAKWIVRSPAGFVAAFAVFAIAITSFGWLSSSLYRGRSYFGAYRVMVNAAESSVILVHGQINHGYQYWKDGEAVIEPTSYYSRGTGVGRAFAELTSRDGPKRVAAVGLGTGIVAAYVTDDMQIDFYEIDPLILDIASRYFTFLDACGDRCRVILGDARIQLEGAPDAAYDLIIEDAFNSDSVPVHLLTREAMALYVEKLAPDGILAFHLSNKYLDLPPVVAALAKERGLALRVHIEKGDSGALWLLVARNEAAFGSLRDDPDVRKWEGRTVEPWTDDFADVISALRW